MNLEDISAAITLIIILEISTFSIIVGSKIIVPSPLLSDPIPAGGLLMIVGILGYYMVFMAVFFATVSGIKNEAQTNP
jgi:hypothetical protein